MHSPKRYHPLLVSLHWLVAILVALNLYLGLFVFLPRGHTDLTVAVHMAAGLAVLALVIVRFGVRLRTPLPAEATSGSPLLDMAARAVHADLYILLMATTIIGLVFAVNTNHFQEAFLGAEEPAGAPADHAHPAAAITPLPTAAEPQGESYDEYNEYGATPPAEAEHTHTEVAPSLPPQAGTGFLLQRVHLWSSNVLMIVIGLHVLAGLYHQFILKDKILSRMWW